MRNLIFKFLVILILPVLIFLEIITFYYNLFYSFNSFLLLYIWFKFIYFIYGLTSFEETYKNKNAEDNLFFTPWNRVKNTDENVNYILLYNENIELNNLIYVYKKHTTNKHFYINRIIWLKYCLKMFTMKVEGLLIATLYNSVLEKQLKKLEKLREDEKF